MRLFALAICALFVGCTHTTSVVVVTTTVVKKNLQDGDLYPKWMGDLGLEGLGEKVLNPDKADNTTEGYLKPNDP